jgi:hypothetical protein
MSQAKEGALAGAFEIAVAPDGNRIAVLIANPQPLINEIRVVTNWAGQLSENWR